MSQKAKIPKNHPHEKTGYLKDLEHEQTLFKTSGGRTLYTQNWAPTYSSKVKANILWVHGYADHSSRFTQCASNLVKNNFHVFALDHWGHGFSEGTLGYLDDLSKALNDVVDYFKKIKKEFPNRKLFVMGESMGGNITIQLALKHSDLVKDSGVVLIVPMIEVAKDSIPNGFVIGVAKALNYVIPNVGLVEGNAGKNSFVKEIDDEFLNDPYTYSGKVKIATGMAMYDGTQYVQKNLKKVNVPFLVLTGDKDRACDYTFSVKLHKEAISKDKEIKIYKGFEHMVIREPKNTVEKDYTEWITKRL